MDVKSSGVTADGVSYI